ncbi:MAG: T9SS type A sorting domain-containing protein [Bacteroidetes bacterium]|nr:T9SS type A sorting domain-containing protein [Bacteroidota bacterium]
MKKLLQITTAMALTFFVSQSKAQVVTGSLSADWTLTDLNGVSHNLYTYLNAGKTVFIDISATWCAPCWGYHNTHAFDDVWINHGPAGAPGVSGTTTDDCMVFFVEGDGSTSEACLHGSTGCVDPNNSNTSQGDWVTGVDHPIINPTSTTTPTVNAFNDIYNLGYFPTCVMICPNRSMTEVDQFTAAELYAAKSACSAASVAVDGEMITSLAYNTTLASCDSVTPTFRLGNIGTDTLTSATITLKVDGVTQKTIYWTGNLGTYESATITGVKVGSLIAGTRTITAIISNPNGVVDPTSTNNSTEATFVIYPTVGGTYITESFESAGIPTAWTITAGGNKTWDDAPTTGFNSSSSATLNFYNIPSGQVDIMTLPPMSFTGTSAYLTFDVAYAQYSSSNTDKLQVEVSTNCGTTWTSKFSKAGAALKTSPTVGNSVQFVPSGSQWRHETVNLSTYAGQTNVLVRLKGTSDYGNNLYVDNLNFVTSVVGIEENEMLNNVRVYPNPITNTAVVDFSLSESNNVSITLVNALGQLELSKDLGKMSAGIQNYSLDATLISNGLYFLNIKIGDNTITKKVAINK